MGALQESVLLDKVEADNCGHRPTQSLRFGWEHSRSCVHVVGCIRKHGLSCQSASPVALARAWRSHLATCWSVAAKWRGRRRHLLAPNGRELFRLHPALPGSHPPHVCDARWFSGAPISCGQQFPNCGLAKGRPENQACSSTWGSSQHENREGQGTRSSSRLLNVPSNGWRSCGGQRKRKCPAVLRRGREGSSSPDADSETRK
mmetsp:Transcript_32800/g.59986  ORF Transcript_32800/g.59986 Transcript_32800/m.59986 type:complete len:203 (-) Transcript_32800:1635-2243(-)